MKHQPADYGESSIVIAQYFFGKLPEGTTDVQAMGSIGTYVLGLEGTVISPDQRLITAPADINLDDPKIAQFRGKNHKNMRDIDVLLLDTDIEAGLSLKQDIEQAIDSKLKVSVFNLHTVEELREQRAHPRRSLLHQWLSDRYVDTVAGEIVGGQKALFPFSVDLNLETLDTWHLQIGDTPPLPVPHPAVALLNYLTRSVTGRRHKDRIKFEDLARNIFRTMPEAPEWILYGPGREQFEMARALHTMRQPKQNPRSLIVGGQLKVTPIADKDLADHESLASVADEPWLETIVGLTRTKAQLLGKIEENEVVVDAFQRYLERFNFIGSIVTNRAKSKAIA